MIGDETGQGTEEHEDGPFVTLRGRGVLVGDTAEKLAEEDGPSELSCVIDDLDVQMGWMYAWGGQYQQGFRNERLPS